MTIEWLRGDILESPAVVLVNAVNCVGVMGAGLALEFRKRFPECYKDYQDCCQKGRLSPGRLHVYRLCDGRTIVNLPTKRHWREKSRLGDVHAGLRTLRWFVEKEKPFSIALPALGCGLGGLSWEDVKEAISLHLEVLPDVRVMVYEPLKEE